MNIDRKIVNDALTLVRREKKIVGKIIDAIDDKNYTLASYLIAINDKVCEETDKIVKDIVMNMNSNDMVIINDVIEEIAEKKYGGNNCEGKSLSSLISNAFMSIVCDGKILETDTFGEEVAYFIHSLAVDKYLGSKDGLYKDEILDHIFTNMSNTYSLRALFRGDKELFDKYNPDLYFDPIEAKRVGEDYLDINVLTTCVLIEQLNQYGTETYKKLGFSDEECRDIVKSQKDMAKIILAGYYIQTKERKLEMRTDFNNFTERTKEDIGEGFELGEKEYQRIIKR